MSGQKQILAYEDVGFGDELPEVIPDVSMAQIKRFGATTGMTYWRFTDHERARASGLPGAIVPGIMSQGILVSLVHEMQRRDARRGLATLCIGGGQGVALALARD